MLKSVIKFISINKILTCCVAFFLFCLIVDLNRPEIPQTMGEQILVKDGSIHDDNYEVHSFRVSGSGIKTILVSSARTNSFEYNGLIKYLTEAGYQTITPSLSNVLKFEGLSEDSKIVQRILDSLYQRFEQKKYCIISIGYGSDIVREIASQHSAKFNGMVFLSPFGENLIENTNSKNLTGRKEVNFFDTSKAPDYWGYSVIRHSNRRIQESMKKSTRTKWENTHDIPILALLGEADPVTSLEDLKTSFLSQNILKADIKTIQESSSALLYEQPKLLNEYVKSFLDENCN